MSWSASDVTVASPVVRCAHRCFLTVRGWCGLAVRVSGKTHRQDRGQWAGSLPAPPGHGLGGKAHPGRVRGDLGYRSAVGAAWLSGGC
jgi:hypothetical protein